VRTSDVIAAVPDRFNGILDLCVCHPKELAKTLERLRPRCLVRSSNREATPVFWLYFYDVLTTILQTRRTTYTAALEETFRRFLPRSKRTTKDDDED
jgi:hypothetical protein